MYADDENAKKVPTYLGYLGSLLMLRLSFIIEKTKTSNMRRLKYMKNGPSFNYTLKIDTNKNTFER